MRFRWKMNSSYCRDSNSSIRETLFGCERVGWWFPFGYLFIILVSPGQVAIKLATRGLMRGEDPTAQASTKYKPHR